MANATKKDVAELGVPGEVNEEPRTVRVEV
jgi:hypothetical protein